MPQGHFVWCELMTTDTTAATTFYQSVIGWQAADSGMTDRAYTIVSAGPTMVGGIMELPQSVRDNGGRPGWIGYVAVDNVDTTAGRILQAGGAVHHAADDIPGIGRFAVVADPQGAVFVLFKPAMSGEPPPAAGATPGRVGWYELQAGDLEPAFSFYAALFGWTKTDAIDMGPMGIYQLFAVDGVTIGGMMTRMPEVPRPFWQYYFNVDEINAAIARVNSAGGKVVNGPQQVPGGSWIAHAMDPQGVMFAMVSAPKPA